MSRRLMIENVLVTVLVVGLGLWAVSTAGHQVEKAAASISDDLSF
ncbi:hypothetical protein P67b_00019 [Ruegeria phage Tedan]|nr:hypothetical protein P67b_00019 [Ruegeria phage Tedan]